MGLFTVLMDPQNHEVANKLGIATGCMFTLPIVVYYIVHSYCIQASKRSIDNGGITKDYIEIYAGGAAVLMTNLIIAIYCYYAYYEDLYEKQSTTKKKKNDDDNNDDDNNDDDDDHPRVGTFKRRTD